MKSAMRTLYQRSKLFLAASLSVCSLLPFAADADFPYTAAGPGVQWYISDNMLPNSATTPPNGGLALSDADFNNASLGLDAYDGAFAIKVNGSYFVAPSTATLSGTVFDSGLVTSGPLNVQVKYSFMQNKPIVRAIYSFTATAPSTNVVSWDVNLGSDANTTIRATSGNANSGPVALSDRWFVSTDNGKGDAINTIVRWGTNAPQSPESGSILPNGSDLLSDKYTLSFTANDISQGKTTKQLMMFGVLGSISDGSTAARDFAAIFNDPQTMLAQGYFDGGNLQNIVNWGFVPEPSSGALVAAGFGILLLLRRKRV
jgi:hypothetical protein